MKINHFVQIANMSGIMDKLINHQVTVDLLACEIMAGFVSEGKAEVQYYLI